MKINDYRNTQGQFKRKSKFKRLIHWFSTLLKWLIIILIVLLIVLIIVNAMKYKKSSPTVTKESTPDSIQSVMNEAQFQAQMKLQAQTIELNRERQAETDRHQKEMARIESGLEEVRQKELSTTSLQ